MSDCQRQPDQQPPEDGWLVLGPDRGVLYISEKDLEDAVICTFEIPVLQVELVEGSVSV